jgi:hypothetical protein
VKQGLILVEGQTEEAFVTAVLSPYLSRRAGLWLEPTIVTTKRVTGGPSFGDAVRPRKSQRNAGPREVARSGSLQVFAGPCVSLARRGFVWP